MAANQDPLVLELASLPREQTGPFLLLGLDKAADKEQIEAHWAERVKWARKQLLKVPLEDINWARDALNDPERRIRADVVSLNLDLTEGVLRQLALRYGLQGGAANQPWQPLDNEKPLADYSPPADLPDPEALRAGLVVPEIPEEIPAAAGLLERLAELPLDPWDLELGADGARADSPVRAPHPTT